LLGDSTNVGELGFEALAVGVGHFLVLEFLDEIGFLVLPDGQVLVGDD
jgi:hypothetical protein